MSRQLPPERRFQGFPLHICIKIMSVILSHPILKLLNVSNQVKLRAKVNGVARESAMAGYEGLNHSLEVGKGDVTFHSTNAGHL